MRLRIMDKIRILNDQNEMNKTLSESDLAVAHLFKLFQNYAHVIYD